MCFVIVAKFQGGHNADLRTLRADLLRDTQLRFGYLSSLAANLLQSAPKLFNHIRMLRGYINRLARIGDKVV